MGESGDAPKRQSQVGLGAAGGLPSRVDKLEKFMLEAFNWSDPNAIGDL